MSIGHSSHIYPHILANPVASWQSQRLNIRAIVIYMYVYVDIYMSIYHSSHIYPFQYIGKSRCFVAGSTSQHSRNSDIHV